MKSFTLFFIAACACLTGCTQQNNKQALHQNKNEVKIGGNCEGCEVIYNSPVAFDQLNWSDTLPDFFEPGPKLVISGTIYQADGITPAKDIVLYVYHTDQSGKYDNKAKEKGMAARHGYIKGWIKTNAKGQYRFYTLKPAAYPGRKDPAHIHPVIKEPGFAEYWIDEYLFDDDPLLTTAERKKLESRGGNGVLVTEEKNNTLYAERDIYLGRNVPGYPQPVVAGIRSGLDRGENCPAFEPIHLSGPDKGKPVCPMCKYGYGQGIMLWFNHASLNELSNFAKRLENEVKQKGPQKLCVFLIYMHPFYKENSEAGNRTLRGKLEKWAAEQGLNNVSLLWVPSPVDEESCGLYKINPAARNTLFVYKKRKVDAKYVNLEYNEAAIDKILSHL